MNRIFKYHLELNDRIQEIPSFRYSRIVLVAVQHGRITLWLEFNPDATPTMRRFRIYATGGHIPHEDEHVGSVLMGDFVWHVYEVL